MARTYTPEEHREWLKNLPSIPAGAVLMLEDTMGRLLVVKASYRHYWTPPGGVIDESESPKQAAIRETSEEVGLTIEPDVVRFMGVSYLRSREYPDTFQFSFSASLSKEQVSAIVLGASEIADYDFVTKEQVLSGARVFSLVVTDWASTGIMHYSERVTA